MLGAAPTDPARTTGWRAAITGRWAVAAAALLVAVAGAGWALRGRILPARSSKQVASGPTISLAILPFRNASGDPTLDSLGSSLSEVLRTELGQSSRVRTVPSDRLHQVLQDLRIAPNATLAPDGAGARRGLHERAKRAVGPIHEIRQRDSHRRHAAGSRPPADGAAERHGAERGQPADRHHRARRRGATESGARVAGHPQRAEVDLVETVDELVRGAAALQRGGRADARGQTAGGAEELRGGHESRTAISRWRFPRWPSRTRRSATTPKPASSRGAP